MSQLTRNLDFVAILAVVLFLGIAQAPHERSARFMRATRVLHVAQNRVVPRSQERIVRCERIPHIKRLMYSVQGN